MADKDELVQRAKLAEQAERYDDMAQSMKVFVLRTSVSGNSNIFSVKIKSIMVFFTIFKRQLFVYLHIFWKLNVILYYYF